MQKEESDVSSEDSATVDRKCSEEQAIQIGKVNGGRRIDYVLQEAPLESFNEYIFALTSHVGYWYFFYIITFELKSFISAVLLIAGSRKTRC